jgi:peptidoglycan/LPS O-acetylase OafA/YrhL
MIVTLTEILLFVMFVIFSFFFQGKKEKEVVFMSVDYTNFLRGIAILLIILMHTSCAMGLRYFTPLGGIGVALFLILSGYGLAESYKKNGITHFWKKKILRIWVPYFLFINTLIIVQRKFSDILTIEYLLNIMCLKTSF